MILNDKSLVAAMKKAAKHGGYKVLVDEVGKVRIFTDGWFASMERLPRKVAALLVEHLGYLPKCGERLCITEKYEPQTILEEVAEEEASAWTKTGDIEGALKIVQIQFSDLQLFQDKSTKKLYGVKPVHLNLLEEDTKENGFAFALGHGRIAWQGGESFLAMHYVRPDFDDADSWICKAWQTMETVPLRKEK